MANVTAIRGEKQMLWWVNQGNTYEEGKKRGQIRAEKVEQTFVGRVRVKDVRKGDLIVHFAKGEIRAIGEATGNGFEDPNGWEAPVKYKELNVPIPLDKIKLIARQNKNKVTKWPMDCDGNIKQRGYLFEVPPALRRELESLLLIDSVEERGKRKTRKLAPGDATKHVEKAKKLVPYELANEDTKSRPATSSERNQEAVDRASNAHSKTQNKLWSKLEERGGCELFGPEKGTSKGGKELDLAWIATDRTLFVAEVKSITSQNETGQLRRGLGQVLHYKHLYEKSDLNDQPEYQNVVAVLAVEKEPLTVRTWKPLCETLGVQLWWPGQPLPETPSAQFASAA